MKGVIITNAYDKSDVQRKKAMRMTEELARLGVQTQVISNDGFVAYVDGDRAVCNLDAHFVLYFDKDKYTAQLLEACGIRVFNCARATEICDDKMQTHLHLCGHVPMPTTLPGALCYTKDSQIDKGYLQKAVEILGLPMVVKQCYGSFGEQVYLVNTIEELYQTVSSIKHKAYLLQRYVRQSHGKDVRVIVIGGMVVASMLRQNDEDFRSNVALGGRGVPYQIDQKTAEICQKTAEILQLDYCGIDILLGDTPLLCEVNSNAMFEGIELATGVNVGRLYAEHIVNSVKNTH